MGLDAIGIISKNLKKSISFYKLLGVNMTPAPGGEHFEGVTPSGVRIMLDSVDLVKKINPDFTPPSGSPIVLCFKKDSPKEVDELFKKIKDDGFEVVREPWDAFWGQRYASVKDPDGNQIDIFATL